MATKFGDFNKEVKDLFTKNTAEGKPEKAKEGAPKPVGFAPLLWKVESKFKTDKTKAPVVINPVFEQKADGTADATINVEFCCPLGIFSKVKTALKKDLMKTKPTVTWECCGNKVEAGLPSLDAYTSADVTLETKQKVATATAKVEHRSGEKAADSKATIEAAAPVVPGISVGGSLTVPYGKKVAFNQWSAGVRVAMNKCCTSFLTTEAIKKFAVGAVFEIPGFQLADKPVQGALQVDYALAASATTKGADGKEVTTVTPAALNVTAGLAGVVPGCACGSQWKVKVDMQKNVSISHFVKLGAWGVASTVDVRQRKLGMLLTCE